MGAGAGGAEGTGAGAVLARKRGGERVRGRAGAAGAEGEASVEREGAAEATEALELVLVSRRPVVEEAAEAEAAPHRRRRGPEAGTVGRRATLAASAPRPLVLPGGACREPAEEAPHR